MFAQQLHIFITLGHVCHSIAISHDILESCSLSYEPSLLALGILEEYIILNKRIYS